MKTGKVGAEWKEEDEEDSRRETKERRKAIQGGEKEREKTSATEAKCALIKTSIPFLK